MRRWVIVISLIALAMILSCSSIKPSGTEKNDPPDPPSNPYPVDGATNQEININMTWGWNDPDGDTLTFDLYFGTDANPPLIQSGLNGSGYSPDSLQYNNTYYWKVVADDGHGHQTGSPVWHFSTRALRSFDFLGQYVDIAQGPYYDVSGNIQSHYLVVTNRHSSGTRDSSLIINFTDLQNISVAGYVQGALFGNQTGVGYMYSVGRRDSGFKLRAYSLGDPTNPNEEFRFDVANILDLVTADDYVYLYMNRHDLGQSNGIIVVHNMAVVETLTTYLSTDWGRLRVAGNKLLLAENEAVEIIDISNPASPQILATSVVPDQCRDAAVVGTTIYIALHNTGVGIADISSLPAITPVGFIASVNNSTDILLISSGVLHVADNDLLVAYNINNPASPYEIARFQAPAQISSMYYLQDLIVTYNDSANTSGILWLRMQP
jgi:hypothetical protein